ncbi:anti-phage dCTP deaminase [Pseudomonas sp. ICMP 460]|uniref:anti-phage dCTP deaminase n=1 Tax=Pseudomonas sp. ICMP 460 TaxID=1718917 RepID=UPI000C07453D|nr:anti-phage dCTP deaminase [Pseudomonas sp. ICMP 460]PHN33217.1 cytidine deaminase [Pseudomonas sp. ICMP 460]
MAAPDFRLIASANSDKGGHFDDIGAIGKTITPEIVIALCGPMGTPLHDVAKTFQELLLGTDYNYEKVNIIRLSDEIRKQKSLTGEKSILKLIEAGNELREEHGNEILARFAIRRITLEREEAQQAAEKIQEPDLFDTSGSAPTPKITVRYCHIIDSIKHIDELRLLRSVYGDMLHVVGVYSPIELRITRLERYKGQGDQIHDLIDRDSGEEMDHGQRVEDTFPQADFFLRVEKTTDTHRKGRVKRFLDLILGTVIATPTLNERAMYAAFSAARNSACLSRQVGAAITSEEGEILATGWNDVPKAFGGLYQTESYGSSPDEDRRCWNLEGGRCSNDQEKEVISNAIVDLLSSEGLIDEANREKVYKAIRKKSQLKSLIEFSRAVHAEMHALLSAGSTDGGKIRDGKLFVTTYPCHSCARHIVAAGVREVYFLEPYRKSLATKLHEDAITENENETDKVRVMPFDGVAPSRFLRFFSAHPNGRKNSEGVMQTREAHPVAFVTMEAIPTLESLIVQGLSSRGI